VVSEVEMSRGIEPQHAMQAFAVLIEHVREKAQRTAGIGDNQAHVEVVGRCLERVQKTLFGQVQAEN
jgi:hypothetical protein